MTGAAATEIGGETTAREFGLMDKTADPRKYQPSFVDTRLSIIDEISFMKYQELQTLSENLRSFTECRTHLFGKHPIVFLGDFCQLECIGGDCIYLQEKSIYWEQALTCMVELEGTHRYKDCENMKTIMPTMRDNGLSDAARNILNSRVIDGTRVKMPDLKKTRFATFHNRNRAQINASVFEDYLKEYHGDATPENIPKTAIVIRAGAKWYKRTNKLSFAQRKTLYTQCSEADCKDSQNKRCDPLLCLFYDCHLMGTKNDDVQNGIANGTTSVFKRVVFKSGCTPKPMKMHGRWVYGIDIEDVDHLVLRWQDSKFQGEYKVFSDQRKFRVQYPIDELGFGKIRVAADIDMTSFPIVLNHATTGHKLQGKSLDELVIAEWSKVKNWAYVVLSRVRKLEGLFLTEPIPLRIDFRPKVEYLKMMERLQSILASEEDVRFLKEGFSLGS